MAVKSKAKVKSKVDARKRTAKRAVARPRGKSAPAKRAVIAKEKNTPQKVATEMPAKARPSARPPIAAVKRIVNPLVVRQPAKRVERTNQFNYMKAPGLEHVFEVGDTVEVFCDHEKSRERIRGWVKGIVVQVDHKMVAVQFRSNVYLTDGWMVPDRILWYPVNSEHIRPLAGKKTAARREFLPDY